MTVKIYETEPLVLDFEAEALSCTENRNEYSVVLDRTAFFPEGGGQLGDSGKIAGARVTDTIISDGVIIHKCASPVTPGRVSCSVDKERRMRNMQNHTGEHILSGRAHSMFGCTNVGFRLGEDRMTVDFDVELSEAQTEELERAANDAVYADLAVTSFYPSTEELSSLDYRSKLDMTENVRLVRIEGVDLCACCAPHLPRTSMVGLVKILSRTRWKGGVRLEVLCGQRAVEDYSALCAEAGSISALLSCESRRCSRTVEQLKAENDKLKMTIRDMSRAFAARIALCYDRNEANVLAVENSLDDDGARELANILCEGRDGVVAVMRGDDEKGYSYVLRSDCVPLRSFTKDFNSALSGRGGGDDRMTRGRAVCTEQQARSFLRLTPDA